jgi:hypothetical protein
VFSAQILQENTFLETKPNFSLTGKYFPLTNFSNNKQTQKSLKNNFLKTIFQKTNIPFSRKQTWIWYSTYWWFVSSFQLGWILNQFLSSDIKLEPKEQIKKLVRDLNQAWSGVKKPILVRELKYGPRKNIF